VETSTGQEDWRRSQYPPRSLVGIYSDVDEGPIAYRRTLDGRVFRAGRDEGRVLRRHFESRIDGREEITFTGWLTDMILRGVFEPLDEYAE
jgi:hypothetical protein